MTVTLRSQQYSPNTCLVASGSSTPGPLSRAERRKLLPESYRSANTPNFATDQQTPPTLRESLLPDLRALKQIHSQEKHCPRKEEQGRRKKQTQKTVRW